MLHIDEQPAGTKPKFSGRALFHSILSAGLHEAAAEVQ
jgi:hypothetical protein